MNIATPTKNSNPSFQMNVQFQYRGDNVVLRKRIKLPYSAISGYPTGWAKADAAKGKDNLFTELAADCNIIGFSNGKRAVMRHLIPDKKNLEMKNHDKPAPLRQRLLSRLQEELDSLKAEDKIKTVFIIAGQPRENMKSRSLSMLLGLIDFCKSNGLEPTIIWGQKKGGALLDALFDVKKDTLTVQPNIHGPIISETVKDYFSWMKFNKDDEILMPDRRKINKASLEKKDEALVNLEKRYF